MDRYRRSAPELVDPLVGYLLSRDLVAAVVAPLRQCPNIHYPDSSHRDLDKSSFPAAYQKSREAIRTVHNGLRADHIVLH